MRMKSEKITLTSWALYDFANTIFSAVVLTVLAIALSRRLELGGSR